MATKMRNPRRHDQPAGKSGAVGNGRAPCRAGGRASGRAGGFTLLEVLVALVIVGTALGASLRAVGSLTQNSNGLRGAMMATWSAENRMVQLRLSKTFPAVGKQTYECPQGDMKLMCEEEVIASPNPRFRRVEVSVFDQSQPERRIIKLVQLVLNS